MELSDYIDSINTSVDEAVSSLEVLQGDKYTLVPRRRDGELTFSVAVPIPDVEKRSAETFDKLSQRLSRERDAANYQPLNPIVYLSGEVEESDTTLYRTYVYIPLNKLRVNRLRDDLTIADVESSIETSVAMSVINNAHRELA